MTGFRCFSRALIDVGRAPHLKPAARVAGRLFAIFKRKSPSISSDSGRTARVGSTQTALKPRYPSRRGFFRALRNLCEPGRLSRYSEAPLPPLCFRDFSPARIDLPVGAFPCSVAS